MKRRQFLSSTALAFTSTVVFAGCVSVKPANSKEGRAVPPQASFRGRPEVEQRLNSRILASGFTIGARVHLMAFKESKEMEVWMEKPDGTFALFDILPICAFSGQLGPKLAEGDSQTPEGFYTIGAHDLFPNSAFHLALDIDYPNNFDRQLGRTGSLIRIHGSCQSIGCYSMGDPGIEAIYLLAEKSFLAGERQVTFAAYPFRPTSQRLAQERGHVWHRFWTNLAGSYRIFMNERRPPVARVVNKRYIFS